MALLVEEGIPITPQCLPPTEELEITDAPGEISPKSFNRSHSRRWRHFAQERSRWCWAACAQMVADYYGSIVTQCALAHNLFDEEDCCESGSSFNSDCDQACSSAHVARRMYPTVLNLGGDRRFASISFSEIDTEIAGNRRPVLVGLQWTEPGMGGGHLVAISGFSLDDEFPDDGWLTVHDPLEGDDPQIEVRYSYLESAYGLGEWRDSWVNIGRIE